MEASIRLRLKCFRAAFLLAAIACELPKSPSLEADFSVPMANKTYDIFDVKDELENGKDSVRLEIVADSVLFTVAHDETIMLGDRLNTDPVLDSAEGLIEDDLVINDSIQAFFSLGFIAPTSITDLHGSLVTVPPFSVPLSTHEINFDQFSQMTIVSGYLRTRVSNQTSLDFDSLQIDVYDPVSMTVIDTLKVSGLAQGGGERNHSKYFFSSTPVNSPLQVSISGYSSGSATPIVLDSNEFVDVDLRFDVKASTITGLFPSQTIVRLDSIKPNTSSVIDTGYIERGQITVDVQLLGLEIGAVVDFHSDDFDSAGTKLNRRIRIPAPDPIVVDLAKWSLIPRSSAIGEQYINYSYTIVTDSSTNLSSTIATGQGVKALATLDTLVFSRLRARLAREEIAIDPVDEKIQIEELDSIQLQRAYFEIISEHRIPFPISLDMVMTGVKTHSSSQTVAIQADIPEYDGGPLPRRDTIRTTNYEEVAQLLSLLPDSIYITGKSFIGDNMTVAAVNKTDFINVKFLLRAPLVFSLPNDTTLNIIRTKPSEMNISEKDKKRIHERLRRVMITGKIINHFPVPVLVQFMIDSLADKDSFYANQDTFQFRFPNSPLLIDKGITDANGVVITPRTIDLEYVLLESDYQRLFDPAVLSIYHGFRVQLLGTGGVVRVSSNDFVDVDTQMEFRFFIDDKIKH